jgi:glycosyltransferase involved in cell wall biosynthesis
MTLVSVQPFGVQSPGGGSRILRSLFAAAPSSVLCVATLRIAPPPSAELAEVHVALRPALPTDGSRFDHLGTAVETMLAPLACRRLQRVLLRHGATAVHAVAHSPCFWPAFQAAGRLGLPFLLSVHDDVRYLLRGAPARRIVLERLARAWREADARFVISAALGEEYCSRYGAAEYQIVTDGVTDEDFIERDASSDGELRVYFAGLFHRGYRPNLAALASALDLLSVQPGAPRPSLLCRCGSLPETPASDTPVTVVPFGTQAQVRAEMGQADVLYMPLMFDPSYSDMIAFSLSTKLITYLASGVPILYHGPPHGAAYELLAAHDAGILATSSDPAEIASSLVTGLTRGAEVVDNARALAAREFSLHEQRQRFWSRVPGAPALVS